MSPPVRYRRSPAVLFREAAGDVLLARPGKAGVDLLSGTAGAVWRLLDRPRSLPELSAELGDRYGVAPATVGRDVEPLLGELVRRQMVEELEGVDG